MDINTMIIIFILVVFIVYGVAYYLLRKLDKKNKDKYPEKFDGKLYAIDIPGDGEYLCKRYWIWQVEKRKFLEKKLKEEQRARNLSGAIYSRRATKRSRGHVGEKGRIMSLRELYIKVH
ncbi:hypothetical protein MKR37_11170 [Staphylococcus haemolyticus]|uniref:hypothetical protein n=1 Tax=Staphylococcus haemolyticus TaxID=1283 RepID=UPI001F0AECED|nr:hypothetical protein [Staphylococcus haemolyticus]MCH4484243.1 hypothetical protein [Staphylococcus haemolyticus]